MRYLILALSFFSCFSYAATAPNNEEVLHCVKRNVSNKVFQQSIRFEVFQLGVLQRSTAGQLIVNGSDDGFMFNLGVREPQQWAGTSLLLREQAKLQDRVHLYVAPLRLVRRLTSAMAGQPLWATDFNYLDLQHIYAVFPSGAETGFDPGEWQGHSTYSRGVTPKFTQQSVYQHIRYDIDREHCVMAALEFENVAGQVVKRLEGDMSSLIEFDGGYLLRRYVMRDKLNDLETLLELGIPQLLEKPSASIFSPDNFYKVHQQTPAAE